MNFYSRGRGISVNNFKKGTEKWTEKRIEKNRSHWIAPQYYLTTGVDAGVPFKVEDEAAETNARKVARTSKWLFETHRRLRPPSCGSPLTEDEGRTG